MDGLCLHNILVGAALAAAYQQCAIIWDSTKRFICYR